MPGRRVLIETLGRIPRHTRIGGRTFVAFSYALDAFRRLAGKVR